MYILGHFEKSIFYDFTPPSLIDPKYDLCDKVLVFNASQVNPSDGSLISLPSFIKLDTTGRRLRVYLQNTTDNQALFLHKTYKIQLIAQIWATKSFVNTTIEINIRNDMDSCLKDELWISDIPDQYFPYD